MKFRSTKEIHVETGSVVTASMTQTQGFVIASGRGGIANYARWGNDLIVELSSGKTMRINNFFINGPSFHKLTLVDGKTHIEIDFSHAMANSGDGIAEEAVQYHKMAEPMSTKTLLAILGGGAALAGGTVALAGGGGKDTLPLFSKPAMKIVIKDDQEPGVGLVENGGATNDKTPALEGIAAIPGAAITIRLKGFDPVTVRVNGDGTWNYTFPELKDGTYEASVIQIDGSGRIIGESVIKFTVDTVAPDSPLLEKVEDNVTPVAGELKDGDFTNDPQPAFSGKAEAGALIRVYEGTKLLGSVLADKDGNWSFELGESLSNGTHELHFTATDLAGNESKPGPVFHITVDTIPPALLDMRGIELKDETGAIIKNGEATESSDLVFTGRVGSVEAKWIEIIGNDGQVAARIEVGADGNWSWSFGDEGLKLGWQTFQFRAVDAAGNMGPLTKLFSFEFRNKPPAVTEPDATDNAPHDDTAAMSAQDRGGHDVDTEHQQEDVPAGRADAGHAAFSAGYSAHVNYGALQGRFADVHSVRLDKTQIGGNDNAAASAVSHEQANVDNASADHPGIADLLYTGVSGDDGLSTHTMEMLLMDRLPFAPLPDNPDMDAAVIYQQVIV